MYRHCMFCSADLGRNDTFEAFPVGQRLAFDARKGRLWAVCPRCARWNLAPLEERWEAVESAERLFREARLRVQSENVGLARLGDRTRLVRIGDALPGELAAWRYGRELRRRHVRYWWSTAGLLALGDVGLLVLLVRRHERSGTILHRLSPGDSPTGAEVHVQAGHLRGARVMGGSGADGLRLVLPRTTALLRDGTSIRYAPGPSLTLERATAEAVLARALVQVNRRGAPRKKLHQALELLSDAGSAATCIARLGSMAMPEQAPLGFRSRFGRMLVKREGAASYDRPDRGVAALALEMALHEETERRAMEGELMALEASWREAEEIAAIADALPDGAGARG